MEKKTKTTKQPTSSGAEKVKRVQTEKKNITPRHTTNSQEIANKVKKEDARAEKRLEIARIKAEKKAQRKEKMAEMKERRAQRIAQWKEKIIKAREERREKSAERKAAKTARRELLKNETRTQRQERLEREKNQRLAMKEKLAEQRHERALYAKQLKQDKHAKKMEERQHKREEKTKRRGQRTPGFGGWLAAVISLGCATLALAAIVTVGIFNINTMTGGIYSNYESSLYELQGLMDNLDSNLNKLRVSAGSQEQTRLLTDILVQSELAESSLEHFPVDSMTSSDIASFINRASDYSRNSLQKLAAGEKLTEEDEEVFEYMYNTNSKIRNELNRLSGSMSEKDMKELMNNKADGRVSTEMGNIGKNTIETPKSIYDGPFAQQKEKVNAKGLQNLPEITSSQAEEKAREYFADYDIREANCTGEVNAQGITMFNVILKDGRNREFFAQISKAGGKMVLFDTHEDCTAKNFNTEQCVQIARQYLEKLGYENMQPVWLQENGTTANINFCYEQDGVIVYSDMAIVKVCETKGKAIGLEAIGYWLNHSDRNNLSATISEGQASAKVSSKLEVESIKLTLIPINGQESLAYEFAGKYKGSEYFVYIDAKSGNELEIFSVINTKQGRLLM